MKSLENLHKEYMPDELALEEWLEIDWMENFCLVGWLVWFGLVTFGCLVFPS